MVTQLTSGSVSGPQQAERLSFDDSSLENGAAVEAGGSVFGNLDYAYWQSLPFDDLADRSSYVVLIMSDRDDVRPDTF